MSLKLAVLKHLGLLIFLLLLLSCGGEGKKIDLELPNDTIASVDNSLNIDTCSLFYQTQDVSIVNISSLENLENCSGIRGFKFGDSVNKFGDCIRYNGEYEEFKIYGCDDIDFFENKFGLSLIFKDTFLVGFSLNRGAQTKDGVCKVLKKIVDIYGLPNIFSNKFISGNLIDSDEYLRFSNERFAKSYYESFNDAINYMNCECCDLRPVDFLEEQSQDGNNQVWFSPDDRETNDFGIFQGLKLGRQYPANDENGYKVNLRFYDSFKVAYSWNKKRFLIINLSRNKKLGSPGGQLNSGDYKRLYFEDDFGILITFFDNIDNYNNYKRTFYNAKHNIVDSVTHRQNTIKEFGKNF